MLTKVRLVKAVVFPVVMYGCESWTIKKAAAAAAKSLQLCPTLCDPRDSSPPGSSIHGIFQARVLELGAIIFSEIKLSSKELMLSNCGVGKSLTRIFKNDIRVYGSITENKGVYERFKNTN